MPHQDPRYGHGEGSRRDGDEEMRKGGRNNELSDELARARLGRCMASRRRARSRSR